MDTITEIDLFKKLLHYVEKEYAISINQETNDIKDWKGQEIIHFQDELRSKTGSSISEKWFYTYVKNEPEKLPRVDILNMLSQYAGFDNWSAFAKAETQKSKEQKKDLKNDTNQTTTKEIDIIKSLKKTWPFIVAGILSFTYLYFENNKGYDYSFCMIDQDRKTIITDVSIDIILFKDHVKSFYKTDNTGCFKGNSASKNISFIIQSPYHKNDTIHADLSRPYSQSLLLKTDDYALMLDYYSNGKVEEYQQRRKQLDKLIDQEAIIMEVLPHSIGVTLYSKEDFINKLTTPTSSLKRLEIIETKYNDEKITKLKFKIER